MRFVITARNFNNFSEEERLKLKIGKNSQYCGCGGCARCGIIMNSDLFSGDRNLFQKIVDNLSNGEEQDFSFLNLKGINFNKFDWSNPHIFRSANLSNIEIADADLGSCDFSDAILKNTKFTRCDIDSVTNFNEADVKNTIFKNCDFENYEEGDDVWADAKFIECFLGDHLKGILSKHQIDLNEKGDTEKMRSYDESDVMLSAKDLMIFSAATPAVVEIARRSLKKLIKMVVTKFGSEAGKTKELIKSYLAVAYDLLDTHKEEANSLIQLMIGFVSKNLQKAADWANMSDNKFLKFINLETLEKFGTFAFETAKGSLGVSLIKRVGAWFMANFMSAPEVMNFAGAMANPESAPELLAQMAKEKETEELFTSIPEKEAVHVQASGHRSHSKKK